MYNRCLQYSDHPDVNKAHDSSDKFKRITDAYNILKKIKLEENLNEEF